MGYRMELLFGLGPEHGGVGGRVAALPVVAAESRGEKTEIVVFGIFAIIALGVKPANLLAREEVEVLGHVIFQIVFLGLLALMIPVGRLAEHQWLVVDESLAHLGNAEHRAILVHHPGVHRGVYP